MFCSEREELSLSLRVSVKMQLVNKKVSTHLFQLATSPGETVGPQLTSPPADCTVGEVVGWWGDVPKDCGVKRRGQHRTDGTTGG